MLPFEIRSEAVNVLVSAIHGSLCLCKGSDGAEYLGVEY